MKRLILPLACAGLLGTHAALAADVATVNGVAITEAQLSRAVQQSGLPDSAQLRAALKDQLIAREILRQEADKRQYTERPEARQAAGEARQAAALRLYLREQVKPDPVTDAQVRERFDAIVASLGEKEYKTRVIAVAEAATAASLIDRLKAGADFARLAREFSTAPSAARGGELDWVSFKLPLTEGKTQGYPLPLAQAIVKLPAGSVSAAPLAYNGQHYVVKVDEVRATVVPQYEQVKPALRAALEQQELERAMARLVAGLIKDAKIQ